MPYNSSRAYSLSCTSEICIPLCIIVCVPLQSSFCGHVEINDIPCQTCDYSVRINTSIHIVSYLQYPGKRAHITQHRVPTPPTVVVACCAYTLQRILYVYRFRNTAFTDKYCDRTRQLRRRRRRNVLRTDPIGGLTDPISFTYTRGMWRRQFSERYRENAVMDVNRKLEDITNRFRESPPSWALQYLYPYIHPSISVFKHGFKLPSPQHRQ